MHYVSRVDSKWRPERRHREVRTGDLLFRYLTSLPDLRCVFFNWRMVIS
jgi:hypothetical protein